MKNITSLLGVLFIIFTTSCEGPVGQDGFDGLDGNNGKDGGIAYSKVLEIEDDFTNTNDYTIKYQFPSTVEVFESDLVLVYLLFKTINDTNGETVDVWRLLPQTRILDQGLLQYNYDHTYFDVNIFLEADFNLSTLPTGDTHNQVFRIAIIPGEFVQGSKLNKHKLSSVMQRLGVTEKDIQRVKL
ncbi:MAG: collagen-like protein [Cellulophaga sp.]